MNDGCPDIADLERFAKHSLDQSSAASIEGHLARCAECAALADGMAENLKLAAAIRRAPLTASEVLPERVGPYRIIRKLGEGGMGTVYEAEQEHPRRMVALKMIRPGVMSASLLARFRQESQVLGRLKHSGIAQVYEAGTHQAGQGPQPYFVMERVVGAPLLRFADQQHLSTRARLELLAHVCDAVHHAHQQGVIHRDLKPDNILVDESASPPQPKILDFGVARVIDPSIEKTTLHTSAGQIVGTVAYMSPEQAAGAVEEIDTRSDVYALGVMAFQLLSGKLPHRVNMASIAESVRAIVHDEPTALSSIDRSLRGDVTTIVGKALSKERDRRYQSAAEMAADIRRHLKDEPIIAHPPSTMYQLGKFARRNRGLVAGVIAAFVLLVAGVIGTTAGLLRANQQRDLAQAAREQADASAAEARLEAQRQVAVTSFLQDLLGAANPRLLTSTDRAKGVRVTVVDAINAAAGKVDAGALQASPEVEIAVRRIIGVTYNEIGEFEPSIHHLKKSLELAEKVYRGPHRDIADINNSLCKSYRDIGDFPAAEAAGRRGLEVARLVYGADHREVAICMNNLGTTLQSRGQLDEAEQMLRDSMSMRQRLMGDDTAEVASSMNNLAMLVADRGKTDEAESLYRQALATRRKLLGDDHPDVAVVINNLGFVLRTRGKMVEAEQAFRDALAMREKFYGKDHPLVALGMTNLGSVLQAVGKLAEAEPYYLRAIEIQRRASPEPTPNLASMINNFGTLLRAQKKFAEAEPHFRESLSMRLKIYGDAHPSVAVACNNLASVLRELGRSEEAVALSRQAVEIMTKAFGPESGEAGKSRLNLATSLQAAGDLQAAEIEILAAHAIATTLREKNSDFFLNSTRAAVKLYHAMGRAEDERRFNSMLPATRPASGLGNP